MEKGEKEKEEKEEHKKEENSTQNRELKKILVIIGGVLIIFLIGFFVINSIRHFEYRNVEFEVVKEGNIIFYRTYFHVYSSITGKHVADYNFYIRNDPRKLKDIPFEGEVNLKKDMVIRSLEDFQCNGDGVIAIANMKNIFTSPIFGINFFKNDSLGCDSQGRYMFINIQPGDETKVEQYGPACYNLYVNNCEILEVTEKFLVEAIVKLNE